MEHEPSSGEADTKQPLSGTALDSLYPAAKTYDELEQRQQRIEQQRQKRRPKFTMLISSSLVIELVLFTLIHTSTIAAIVFSKAGVMGGVFALFLSSLAMFGIVYWQFQRTVMYFLRRGLSGGWFVWLYLLTSCIAAWLLLVVLSDLSWRASLLVLGGQCAFMLCCAAIYTKRFL